MQFGIKAAGLINALGATTAQVLAEFCHGQSPLQPRDDLLYDRSVMVGMVDVALPEISDPIFNTRCNRLLKAAALQIDNDIRSVLDQYGPDRVAVVAGSSTTGIYEGEVAQGVFLDTGRYPDWFHYKYQELSAPSEFLVAHYGVQGPSYTISTACTSSTKAFGSAARLIRLGIVDAVLVVGADTLCRLTLNGFDCLDSLMSDGLCQPFSANRDGINIGEGAGVMIVTKETDCEVHLLGVGESSDGHHLTAPDPDGVGAVDAMRQALDQAGLETVDYVNLHGTATRANDAMESRAIHAVFGDTVLCSSTKPLTGHTLGAAGITEVGLCYALLADKSDRVPAQIWDGQADPNCPPIRLVGADARCELVTCMSNSFAFGGNNASVILGRPR